MMEVESSMPENITTQRSFVIARLMAGQDIAATSLTVRLLQNFFPLINSLNSLRDNFCRGNLDN